MGIHFDLKRSVDQYMFNLKAANGETVLTSERYKTKQGAEGGIASVKTNAPLEARYRRHDGKAGPYFTLVAANGEPIGTSEAYSSATARDRGIDWVKTNGPSVPTVDNT